MELEGLGCTTMSATRMLQSGHLFPKDEVAGVKADGCKWLNESDSEWHTTPAASGVPDYQRLCLGRGVLDRRAAILLPSSRDGGTEFVGPSQRQKCICQHIIICGSRHHRVPRQPSARFLALTPMSEEVEFASVFKTDRPLRGDEESNRISNAIDEDLKVSSCSVYESRTSIRFIDVFIERARGAQKAPRTRSKR